MIELLGAFLSEGSRLAILVINNDARRLAILFLACFLVESVGTVVDTADGVVACRVCRFNDGQVSGEARHDQVILELIDQWHGSGHLVRVLVRLRAVFPQDILLAAIVKVAALGRDAPVVVGLTEARWTVLEVGGGLGCCFCVGLGIGRQCHVLIRLVGSADACQENSDKK